MGKMKCQFSAYYPQAAIIITRSGTCNVDIRVTSPTPVSNLSFYLRMMMGLMKGMKGKGKGKNPNRGRGHMLPRVGCLTSRPLRS